MLSAFDVTVRGVRSAVHDAGPRGDEAVVFVHGNPGPMDDWADIAPYVAPFCRVVAADLPGFGRADHPRDFDFTVTGYAAHLAGVLDQLGVRRVHLVLHDFGGPWGLQWAVDHPAQLASLTLVNAGVMRGYQWHSFAKLWQTPILGELLQACATDASIRWVMNRDNPRPFPRSFLDRVLGYSDWAQKVAVLKLYRACRDPEQAFGALADRIQRLNPPTCVVWGTEDRYIPVRFAEQQKQVFSNVEVHLIPGAGHWPMIDEPEQTRRPIVDFLRRQVTPALDVRA